MMKKGNRQRKKLEFTKAREKAGYGRGWLSPQVRAQIHLLAGHQPKPHAAEPE